MEEAADAIVAILSDLVAIPSPYPPGDTTAICDYAARRLQTAAYAVETLGRVAGVANVVARLGSGRPQLVFNAHADTVAVGNREEWRSDPYSASLVRVLGVRNQ